MTDMITSMTEEQETQRPAGPLGAAHSPTLRAGGAPSDKVIAEMTEWQQRPLDRVYPMVFIVSHFVGGTPSHQRQRPLWAGDEPPDLRDHRRHHRWREKHPRAPGR